jgi:exopolyphosphatase/guanosine-5'-triphosphate,3'-diphosphate pyrophosphatase
MPRARQATRIGAAVDIGSYSVHLLVAERKGKRLIERHDESAFLGLGRTIDAQGEFGQASAQLIDTLATFAERARDHGAPTVTVVATDPLRRAADAAKVRSDIRAATGLDVAVLTHEEEALVALLGVRSGLPVDRETVMIDAGGGSTEVLVAGPGRAPVAVGLPLGAARLTGVHVRSDPPGPEELRAMRSASTAGFLEAPDARPAELVAVGGTARSLLRVGPRLSNRVLTARRIQRALEIIATNHAISVASQYGIRVSRAHVLAAGASILVAAMGRYRANRIRVAKGGLREGLILASFAAGPRWRDEMASLAMGRLVSGG